MAWAGAVRCFVVVKWRWPRESKETMHQQIEQDFKLAWENGIGESWCMDFVGVILAIGQEQSLLRLQRRLISNLGSFVMSTSSGLMYSLQWYFPQKAPSLAAQTLWSFKSRDSKMSANAYFVDFDEYESEDLHLHLHFDNWVSQKYFQMHLRINLICMAHIQNIMTLLLQATNWNSISNVR